MKTIRLMPVTLGLILAVSLFCCSDNNDNQNEISLWPEIEPFQEGYLNVSDIHEVYYELCGNPDGKPVFVIHGGPGGGCSPYMRRFFNPDSFLIVLHDQRGCGRSKPNSELRDNTTQDLVEDIELLRNELSLDQIILFGGSWGSTLSLAYAETYPGNVSRMVLRGIFLATKQESEDFIDNIPAFFPQMNEVFMDRLPDTVSVLTVETFFRLLSSGSQDDRDKYTKLISRYEYKASGLHVEEAVLDEYYSSEENWEAIHTMTLLEHYYISNGCFLEDGQLLRDAHRIQHIPTTIINGRYDIVCPPYNAFKLHKKLPGSKLIIAENAGHMMGEKPIELELLKAMHP